ncbi:MAG: hypothetical protein IKE17_03670 [Clostridia bacterium]|nr:hypothetical protein [Clostridia bacterium]
MFNRSSILRLALMILAVFALSATPALGSWNPGGVRVTLNEPAVFREGPGEQYEALDILPGTAGIVAIEREDGDGKQWTLCEFQHMGHRIRAYTDGTLRLSDDIPYVSHDRLARHLVFETEVLAAPDLHSETRDTLAEGDEVLFLGFEGDYCFIEYAINDSMRRGYIREESFMPDLGEYAEDFPDNDSMTCYVIKESANMYVDPDEGSEVLFTMPFDASVSLVFDGYYDRAPNGWMPIRYGGLFGWGRSKDFSDLRFENPDSARETLTMMGEYED